MASVLAVDLGGTKVAASVVTSRGAIRGRISEPVDTASPEAPIEQIVRMARSIGGKYEAAGVAVPGLARTDGTVWAPRNYSGNFRGPMTLRDALKLSVNVVTVKLALEVGMETVAQYAQRMGLDTPLPRLPAVAIGAAEVIPLQVTEAYGVWGERTMAGRTFMGVARTTYLIDAGGKVELRRIHLERDSPLVQAPLHELDLPDGSLVAALPQNGHLAFAQDLVPADSGAPTGSGSLLVGNVDYEQATSTGRQDQIAGGQRGHRAGALAGAPCPIGAGGSRGGPANACPRSRRQRFPVPLVLGVLNNYARVP